MSRIVILAILVWSVTLLGCVPQTEHDKLKRQYQNQTQQLSEQGNARRDLTLVLDRLYERAKNAGSISAFKAYLDVQHDLSPQFTHANLDEAHDEVFDQIKSADYVDGYVYFLEEFGDSRGVPKEHLDECIAYLTHQAFLTAKQSDDFSSYRSFLQRYPGATEEQCTEALERALNLTLNSINHDLQEFMVRLENESSLTELERDEKIKTKREDIATYYRNRISDAYEQDDLPTLRIYRDALIQSKALSDTAGRAKVLEDRRLEDKLDELAERFSTLQADIQHLSQTLVSELHALGDQHDLLSEQLNEVILNQRTQVSTRVRRLIMDGKLPFNWDPHKSAWMNTVEIGKDALVVFSGFVD